MPSYPGGVGLTIGLPLVGRPVVAEWTFAMMNIHPPMNYDVRFQIVKGKPVDVARNEIVEYSKSERAKYLLFIGDDVSFPPHGLKQMLFHMEHNPKMGVIGGIYCHKSHPQEPMVFRGNGIGPYWDWKVGELFQVSGLGMDYTLIRMAVFDDIQKPYYKTVDTQDAMMDGVNKSEAWTEDLYFCKQVTDAGWEVWADGSILCTHWDYKTGIGYNLPVNSKPLMRALVRKGDKKIVDLGSGTLADSYKTDEGEVLRVDIREDAKPDYRCDLRKLPFGTGEFDVVYSSHTLEHFCRNEVPEVIDEWIRIMKPDGELRLMLPNIEWAAQHILNQEIDSAVMDVLYGAQSYNENFHKMGFTPKMVEQLLRPKGFTEFIWDFHNYHMFLRAWKVAPEKMPETGEVNPIIRFKRDATEANLQTVIVEREPQEMVVGMDVLLSEVEVTKEEHKASVLAKTYEEKDLTRLVDPGVVVQSDFLDKEKTKAESDMTSERFKHKMSIFKRSRIIDENT